LVTKTSAQALAILIGIPLIIIASATFAYLVFAYLGFSLPFPFDILVPLFLILCSISISRKAKIVLKGFVRGIISLVVGLIIFSMVIYTYGRFIVFFVTYCRLALFSAFFISFLYTVVIAYLIFRVWIGEEVKEEPKIAYYAFLYTCMIPIAHTYAIGSPYRYHLSIIIFILAIPLFKEFFKILKRGRGLRG